MTNLALLTEADDLVVWVDLILEISMLRIFLDLYLEIWGDLGDSNERREMRVVKISSMISELLLQRVFLE